MYPSLYEGFIETCLVGYVLPQTSLSDASSPMGDDAGIVPLQVFAPANDFFFVLGGTCVF